MEKISPQDFSLLVNRSKIIEKDGYGPKVLLAEDGQIVKIFRRKRLFSSALFYSYACRFAHNAKRLKRLGIPTVTIVRLASCSDPKRQLVWYHPLPGETLRAHCQHRDPTSLMKQLGAFVASLHEKGVLFRSLHWGNIIVGEDQALGLIDMADLTIQHRPLNLKQRQRNFGHMLRYEQDREMLEQHAVIFWKAYQSTAGLTVSECAVLRDVQYTACK